MTNDSEKYPEMYYFMNESLSDFTFVIEGQKFPVLKSFLSVKSKVFRELFSENFREVSDNEVVIEDTTFEAFKTFIRYLYCDQLILSNEKDLKLIEDIYNLSDKYNVFRLKERIIKFLLDFKLDFDLWEEIFKIAIKYEIKELGEKVISLMEKNIINFIDKGFKDIFSNRFMEMLDNISHKISSSSKNMLCVIKSARDGSHNYEVEEQFGWFRGRRESLIQCCQRAINSAHDYHTIEQIITVELNEIFDDVTCCTSEKNCGTTFRGFEEHYIRIRFGRLIIEVFGYNNNSDI